MNRSGKAATASMAAVFLLLAAFPAGAQDGRGPAGLPVYLKTPEDRPVSFDVETVILPANLSAGGVLASIPDSDSVIVINGKVDMGGRDYFYAYPKVRAGSIYESVKACRKEYMLRPQYKAAEKEGYALFVVFRNTATVPECWTQFRNLDTIDLSVDRILVKPTEAGAPVEWDNPQSTYANSYDLRTLRLGPVTPR